MNTTVQIFIDFISLWTQILDIYTNLFKYTSVIRKLCYVSCTLFDLGSSSSPLKKKNKWISIFNILLPLYFFIDSKVKRNYAPYTLCELHYSSTTSWNIYCSKPMHLLGLGKKFGVRIINTTKTPDKRTCIFLQ